MSEFRVLPWEHRGVKPVPHREAEREVEGRNQKFWLKEVRNRLFFCRAGEPRTLWAIPEPVRGQMEAFWNEQVERGNFGRYWVQTTGFSCARGHATPSQQHLIESHTKRRAQVLIDETSVGVIVREEGEAWACEWCDHKWLSFVTPPLLQGQREARSIWDRPLQPKGLRRAILPLGPALATRPFDPLSLSTAPLRLRWIVGSQEELIALIRIVLTWHVETLESLRAELQYWGLSIQFQLQCESELGAIQLKGNWPRENPLPGPWNRVLCDHNLAVGRDWKERRASTFHGQRDLRLHWQAVREQVWFSVDLPDLPTAHERMEAQAQLREWLRGKVSDAEAEELLAQ